MVHNAALRRLLAAELNCDPDIFRQGGLHITEAKCSSGKRQYVPDKPFFQMCTTGRCTVISADSRLHGFLQRFTDGMPPYKLFQYPRLKRLEEELAWYGYELGETAHMYLLHDTPAPQGDLPVEWFFDREIDRFYGDPRFRHALCPQYTPERPDTAAVCAVQNGEIIGMAGCSRDAEGWEQIGIDVVPEHRGKGIAPYLVALLRDEILRRGEIPFYGTAGANIPSQQVARKCGFVPVWVELWAEKQDD